ncbi:hypothetical protein PM082_022134 [Marasmius tenuissimus]|nr:hypothetical protein PM082_022134 [Marasmius tenuissimus]
MYPPGKDELIIGISTSLRDAHPTLIAALTDEANIEATSQTREHCEIQYPCNDSLTLRMITWIGCESRAGILWADAEDFLQWINNGLVHSTMTEYRQINRLTIYSDIHVILFNTSTLSAESLQVVTLYVKALRVQMHTQVHCVENMKEAAQCIVKLTKELFAFLEDSANNEIKITSTYARMLMSVPGMNVSRVELVMF